MRTAIVLQVSENFQILNTAFSLGHDNQQRRPTEATSASALTCCPTLSCSDKDCVKTDRITDALMFGVLETTSTTVPLCSLV